jgi:hypothetical protein
VQGHDERGGAGFGPVHVDVDRHGLVRGLGEPGGGREDLSDGALSDAGYLAQPVRSRLQHPAHRAEAALLDGAETQPALGDVLQPGDGEGVEFPGDDLVVQRTQRRPHRLDGPPVVPGDAPRRLVQPHPARDRLPLTPPHAARPSLAVPRILPPCVSGRVRSYAEAHGLVAPVTHRAGGTSVRRVRRPAARRRR